MPAPATGPRLHVCSPMRFSRMNWLRCPAPCCRPAWRRKHGNRTCGRGGPRSPQGMALAGHDGKSPFGAQLATAGVSESRVTKLLTSRGNAFRQLLPRVLRLLVSHGVAPNWRELGELVLNESSTDRQRLEKAESIRLRIAGPYFSNQARAAAR